MAEQKEWTCAVVAMGGGDSEEKNEAPEAETTRSEGEKNSQSCIRPPSAPRVKGH